VVPWGNRSTTVSYSLLLSFIRHSSRELDGQTISSLPFARPFTQYFIGTQEGAGKMYPWLHQQAIEEGLRNLTGASATATSCQFMSLTRSTFVGGQRFCSYLWSGDTDSRFDVLLQQITAGVSVAASGISSWTLDIGGFAGLNIDTDFVREGLYLCCKANFIWLGARVVCAVVCNGGIPSIRTLYIFRNVLSPSPHTNIMVDACSWVCDVLQFRQRMVYSNLLEEPGTATFQALILLRLPTHVRMR
jgi:hypothetical protein